MRVAVVGCGYVGLVTGVGMASVGHDVLGIEVDRSRRERIAGGSVPFHEPGLQDLLRSELGSGRFGVSSEMEQAGEADVVLLAVQTPPDPTGAIDLQFLERAGRALVDAFSAAPRQRAVVVRSTVVPGTAERVLVPLFDENAAVASNPEFLREGSALQDFLHPDRIVIGCEEDWARELLSELYRPFDAPLVLTSPATAELAKYTSNAFLATLVSFSNEISRVCESLPGVDVEDVLGILHTDRRLSPAVDGEVVRPGILSYLKAGVGYGGSCLPKDVSALIAAGRVYGEELPLLQAVRGINDAQPARVVASAERALGELEGRAIAVLGVAFKGDTDDLRCSPGLRIVDELLDRNAEVTVYDPLVSPGALAENLGEASVTAVESLAVALETAEACIITTNAREFADLGALLAERGRPGLVVIDGRRVLAGDELDEAVYVAVGRAADPRSGGHSRTREPAGSRPPTWTGTSA